MTVNELQLTMTPKGNGVWNTIPIRPADFFESSANIAVSVAATGIGPTLTFNASAGTSDIAITQLVLPPNFKRQMQSSNAGLRMSLSLGNIAVGAGTNDDLKAQLKFVFKPPADNVTDADIVVDYLGKRIRSATVGDPASEGYLTQYTVDVLAGLTSAQKKLLDEGWTVYAYLRPHETVGTDVAMVCAGGSWQVKLHLKEEPTSTLTTLA